MWRINKQGEREFFQGKEDWALAARLAEECPEFRADEEEEMAADEAVSCYNCRYRRWTIKSFVCSIPR